VRRAISVAIVRVPVLLLQVSAATSALVQTPGSVAEGEKCRCGDEVGGGMRGRGAEFNESAALETLTATAWSVKGFPSICPRQSIRTCVVKR